MEMVGTKILKESYILQYHCDNRALLLNKLVGFDIKAVCEESEFPLDAFVISKTGMGKDFSNFEDEEMPSADYCHLKDSKTNKYITANCGKMFHSFPYTNEMIGYKLIPITDDNRDAVYAEFSEKGFFYEKSQAEVCKLKEDLFRNTKLSADAQIAETKIDDAIYTQKMAALEGHNANQIVDSWSDWIISTIDNGAKLLGNGVDCIMDLPHCLGFDI